MNPAGIVTPLALAVAAGLAGCVTPAGSKPAGEPPGEAAETVMATDTDSRAGQERDARMAWWREAKFGLFIHWGLYAVPAGTA